MIIEEMTIPANDLGRFVQAQDELFCDYGQALKEVKEWYKYTHWIWYIFPQLRALGHSRRAKYFGIADMDEAVRYMKNSVLSARMMSSQKCWMPFMMDRKIISPWNYSHRIKIGTHSLTTSSTIKTIPI